MTIRLFKQLALAAALSCLAAGLSVGPAKAEPLAPPASDSGVIRVKSAYALDKTIARLKQDIAAKGIKFFDQIDQAKLASGAGIALRPSVLLLFGNPPLGIQFLTANPYSGLDWPVRMLVFADETGQVWIAYSDFAYIARRHHIANRDAQFKMATEVAASIASATAKK